jgi:hypothetical protein
MSTATDNTIVASNDTAAHFRAWCTFIHNAFLLGFLAGTDSGQVDLTTVAAPSATQTASGYKIYKTNDGLTIVYVKVEFGSSSVATYPSIWITVGTGTNGVGTITGTILFARTQLFMSVQDPVTQHPCFASGANNRVAFAVFLGTAGYPIWFSLERRKDANIADVDTGIIIDWGSPGTLVHSLCAPFTGVIPTPEIGMQFILSSNNPAAYGSTIPEGLRIPCLGPSEPPGRSIAICMVNDYGSGATPTLTINGTNHTFKQMGPNINTLRGASVAAVDVNTRLLLRYE